MRSPIARAMAELSLAGGLSSLDQALWPPATPVARVETRRLDVGRVGYRARMLPGRAELEPEVPLRPS